VSLEDIDLLFGARALGTLPDDLHKDPLPAMEPSRPSPVVPEVEAKPEVEGEAV
jgi:hypothetical protein